MQQVEVNSQQHGDISRNFSQTIGNGLIERVFHRKIQSKKIFICRERIETILLKSNELLLKVSFSSTILIVLVAPIENKLLVISGVVLLAAVILSSSWLSDFVAPPTNSICFILLH